MAKLWVKWIMQASGDQVSTSVLIHPVHKKFSKLSKTTPFSTVKLWYFISSAKARRKYQRPVDPWRFLQSAL